MATRNEIQLLNLAYFGRPSDPAGLSGWESTGLNSSEIVLRFVDTEEYQFNTIRPNQQGSTPNLAGFITTYYQRLFDRAPSQSEIDGWVDALNKGLVNLDYLGLTIANAGLNLEGSDLANTLNNKIAKANGFSDGLAADQTLNERYTSWLAIAIGQDFNSEIGENTTDAEAAAFRAAAFNRLPEVGVLIELNTPNTEVAEGSSVGVQVQGFGPDAPGTTVDYVIIGNGGFGAPDLVNGSLTGAVTLDSFGNGVLQIDILADGVDVGESFAVQFSAAPGLAIFTDTITVIDGPAPPLPDPTLQVSSSDSAVENGDSFVFTVTSTELPAGTQVQWAIAGVSSEDLGNAPTSGVVTLNADGSATIPFQVSEAVSFEGNETASLTVVASGLTATSSVVINNTDIPPVQSVLTTETDVVTNTGAEIFTVFGNEATLGQNDQISSDFGESAVLNIGTEGAFSIGNFTSTNIDTFEFTPSLSFNLDGVIDMRNAFGVTDLEINRSSLRSFQFDDLQSAEGLTAEINDSFTDFFFNFDSTALTGDADSLDVIFAEAPIDAASRRSLGLIAGQGPTDGPASLETLRLTSTGVATDENVLGVLSVGPALETLVIDGLVSLKVEQDIGRLQDSAFGSKFGNSLIDLINASDLTGNLYGGTDDDVPDFFVYTSAVNGDVDVFGAEGFNYLKLNSAVEGATNFDVVTQGGDDSVFTSSGDDLINAGDGDNSVDGGTGDDFVITGSGDDDIQGKEGDDTITSGGGDDVINSDEGNDSVLAGNGDNNVNAAAGDNTVISLEGSDTIVAFNGDDSVDSGFGDDIVVTGDGADTIVSEGGNNNIIAGVFTDPGNIQDEGGDSVVTGGGSDTINVAGGSDTVRSGAGNDLVIEGNVGGGAIAIDGDTNFIFLEEGNDELTIHLDNLQSNDVIDGGEGLDTVTLQQGGVLRQSETLQTRNIEAFNLVDGGVFDITLSNELIATSDNIVGNQRIFSVTTDAAADGDGNDSAGDVTLDITNIAPISEGLDNEPLINSIRYFGQNTTDTERVIVNDSTMNQFTEIRFGEAPANDIENGALDLDSDNFFDVIVVEDSAEITNSDLSNVDGLEVFDLTATNNGDSDFEFDFSAMTIADFKRLVGDIATYPEDPQLIDDGLLFRATPSLNTASASSLTLILPIDSVAAEYVGERIVIEQSAELNVFVENAVVGSEPTINTALFFTPNADDLNPSGQTVVAFELNDVQAADRVTDSGGSFETIDFRFGLANRALSMQEQLNNVRTDEIDIFEFNPGAINQAVEFDGLFPAAPAARTITGLDSVITSGGDDFMINIEQRLFVASNNGADTVTANDDTVTFGSLTVTAGLGADSVRGFDGGDDSLVGNAGDDTISGRSGNDFIAGDEVDGSGTGNDFILSGSGDDTVIAGNGDNSVFSDTGNDSVTSGAGSDTIDSGANNDTVTSGAGDDSVASGGGADSVIAGLGDDTVIADVGDDTVFAGVGDDSVDAGDGNDSVFAGLGFDTIISGNGNDTIFGGVDDDLILFSTDASVTITFTNGSEESPSDLEFTPATPANVLTTADSVDGGDGDDTLAFTLDDSAIIINDEFVQNIEQFNVGSTGVDTVQLDNSILGLNEEVGVALVANAGSDFTFISDTFVQTQSVKFFDSSSTGSREFGAGDDEYFNDYNNPSDEVTISGNGGADIIDLSTELGNREYVRYNTGNDGALVAGAAVGGDSVRNFEVGVDKVLIGTDRAGSPATFGSQAFGLLFDLTQKQSSAISDALLISVENQQLVLGGQTASDPDAVSPDPDQIVGLGQNMLFLTGPARSLTDAELTDASAIAEAINNVGVIGNGLEFGETLPANSDYTIEQQSNQALIVQQGQTGTALWLYIESDFNFDDPLAYTAEANELRQLAIFDDALLTTGDFVTNLPGSAVVPV